MYITYIQTLKPTKFIQVILKNLLNSTGLPIFFGNPSYSNNPPGLWCAQPAKRSRKIAAASHCSRVPPAPSSLSCRVPAVRPRIARSLPAADWRRSCDIYRDCVESAALMSISRWVRLSRYRYLCSRDRVV